MMDITEGECIEGRLRVMENDGVLRMLQSVNVPGEHIDLPRSLGVTTKISCLLSSKTLIHCSSAVRSAADVKVVQDFYSVHWRHQGHLN